jgi:exocyst complex component 4
MLSSSSRAGSTVNSLYGPSRPQRSELRSRQVSTSSNPVTMDRDSISARSDATRFRNGALPLSPMRMPDPLRSNDGDDPEKSPTSLPAVLSAFKSAGNRRRQMTTDSEELEYQRERAKEASLQKARQQRIEDRVPGRRPRGQTKAGDIDGTVPRIQLPLSGGSVSSRLTNVIAVLDRIQDEWAFVVDADVCIGVLALGCSSRPSVL